MVVVVSNQGKVHYLEKDLGYDFPKARALYNECVAEIPDPKNHMVCYYAGMMFLTKCSEVGLYYQ